MHNKEANVKTFIATLANNYSERIAECLEKNAKKQSKKILKQETDMGTNMKTELEKMKELTKTAKNSSRALFSDDTARKVLNHKAKYKVEE